MHLVIVLLRSVLLSGEGGGIACCTLDEPTLRDAPAVGMAAATVVLEMKYIVAIDDDDYYYCYHYFYDYYVLLRLAMIITYY